MPADLNQSAGLADPATTTGAAAAAAPTAPDATRAQRLTLGAYLIAMSALLLYVLMHLWGDPVIGSAAEGAPYRLAMPGLGTYLISLDVRLLLLVAVMGGIGSMIHAATSFADYVGNRRFGATWMWWYGMRPFIGASLALVIYFVVRGGLLQVGTSASVNPYGIAAVSGLAGMFSKQATDKLDEVFRTMFRTAGSGDSNRKDKLDSDLPSIAAVDPAAATAGVAATLAVRGSNFTTTSVALVNGEPRVTTFVDSGTLKVALAPSDVASAGTVRLTVRNANGSTSAVHQVRVE